MVIYNLDLVIYNLLLVIFATEIAVIHLRNVIFVLRRMFEGSFSSAAVMQCLSGFLLSEVGVMAKLY